MARTLAEQGYDVAVHFNGSQEAAESLCAEIESLGRRAFPFQADLTVESDMAGLIPAVCAAFDDPISVLVNNASIFEYDNVQTATRASWDRHFDSNLRAPFVLTQGFADQVPDPVLDQRGEPVAQGLVINMLDQRVRKLTPEFMTYTLAKMGLWAFTQTAAQALAPRIRVNGIGPGPTLRGARQSEAHFEQQRASTILSRGASPRDVTDALVYFLTARSVTGQLLCVDGGQHLSWQTPDVLGVE